MAASLLSLRPVPHRLPGTPAGGRGGRRGGQHERLGVRRRRAGGKEGALLLCRAGGGGEPVWYFAYGEAMNDFYLEQQLGVYPLEWQGAICVRKNLAFSSPGIDTVFEPAFANLADGVKGDLVHGVLISLHPDDMAKMDRQVSVVANGAERVDVRAMAYDRRSIEAATHVVPAGKALDGGLPSARHVEVMLEAARLRSLDPTWVHYLEGQPPAPRWVPPAMGAAAPIRPEHLRKQKGTGRDGTAWVALNGKVFDVSRDAGAEAALPPSELGGDITKHLLKRLYLPDLGSRNPEHWPQCESELQLGEWPTEEKLTSRQLDVLLGWECFLTGRYPLVGSLA